MFIPKGVPHSDDVKIAYERQQSGLGG